MPERGPVLFVDDEASMRQAVTQWLELAGFELDGARQCRVGRSAG